MDPLTAATTLATLVGLLTDFLGERRARSDQDYADFVQWLADKRHHKVVHMLEQNLMTADSLKALLKQDRVTLSAHLLTLDRTLARLAGAVEGLGPIAASIYPDLALSDQAQQILRGFANAGAGVALLSETNTGRNLVFMDATGEVEFTDPQFIDDDLATLLDCGFLRQDYNKSGNRLFRFTRRAADYLKSLAPDPAGTHS